MAPVCDLVMTPASTIDAMAEENRFLHINTREYIRKHRRKSQKLVCLLER
jgi:hypothetical protein